MLTVHHHRSLALVYTLSWARRLILTALWQPMRPFLAHGGGAKVTVEAQEVDTVLAAGWLLNIDSVVTFCFAYWWRMKMSPSMMTISLRASANVFFIFSLFMLM